MNNNSNNKYPEVAFFPTKKGDKSRIYVNPAVYDTLQKAAVGTSLLLASVPEDQQERARANGKQAPTHRMVIMPEGDSPASSSKSSPKRTTKSDAL